MSEPHDLEAEQYQDFRITFDRAGTRTPDHPTRPEIQLLSEDFYANFDELAAWLWRSQRFPHGVVLLTGTGVVPDESFTLQPGDRVTIRLDGVGALVNEVVTV
jgi:2-keto-4-pentenoate hydratase/2-oxohepta-3-ene-1,7-dioic acid hydratase in catechol pathway